MLDRITPVILTFNEAPNIERTLAALSWAKRIVVVDSLSDDETPGILRANPAVRVFQRRFDEHARQWNYAIGETGIDTEWILSLDADYVLTAEFVDELRALEPPADVAGYSNEFQYCIFGRPLRGSVYPPVTTLFRRGSAQYVQDGHTQRLKVRGTVRPLAARIRHDDRKSIGRWLSAQNRYMELEAAKLLASEHESLPSQDRLRKAIVIAPFAVFFYTLFVRRTILDGRAGLYYTLQRTIAEMILSLHLVRRHLDSSRKQ
jgi:glycosyltransferase involved in cell wall biosynthesis